MAKIEITKELIEKIHEMRALGIVEEKIVDFLDLDIATTEVERLFELEKEYITTKMAVEQLKPFLGKLKSDHNYELKILRLIKDGKITATKEMNSKGYRIHKDEIERFIKEESMTIEDWKAKALALEAELNELKKLYAEATKNNAPEEVAKPKQPRKPRSKKEQE